MPNTNSLPPLVQNYTTPSPTTPELVDKLIFLGGVLVGSRALQVETNSYTDYDIVIKQDTIKPFLIEQSSNIIQQVILNVSKYFTVIPPKGTVALVKINFNGLTINLILYEYQSNIDIVKKVMKELKTYDKLKLFNKKYRINAYQNLLLRNGFRLNKNNINKTPFLARLKFLFTANNKYLKSKNNESEQQATIDI